MNKRNDVVGNGNKNDVVNGKKKYHKNSFSLSKSIHIDKYIEFSYAIHIHIWIYFVSQQMFSSQSQHECENVMQNANVKCEIQMRMQGRNAAMARCEIRDQDSRFEMRNVCTEIAKWEIWKRYANGICSGRLGRLRMKWKVPNRKIEN